MFTRAGFNARNTDTGIRGRTRPAGGGRFAPAELRRWQSGDYFWYGIRRAFVAWGEACVLGTWHEFRLPPSAQYRLPYCWISSRREHQT